MSDLKFVTTNYIYEVLRTFFFGLEWYDLEGIFTLEDERCFSSKKILKVIRKITKSTLVNPLSSTLFVILEV